MAFVELTQWESPSQTIASSDRVSDSVGEISFMLKGNFLTAQIHFNGKKISLAFNGVDTWKRKLANVPFDGPVRVDMKGLGPKGTPWSFKVFIEGRQVLHTSGETNDDFLSRSWEIPII